MPIDMLLLGFLMFFVAGFSIGIFGGFLLGTHADVWYEERKRKKDGGNV
jgi:hypothetical protein